MNAQRTGVGYAKRGALSPEAIKRIRVDKLRMTQDEFAQLTGCTLSTVSRWERGLGAPGKMALLHIRRALKDYNIQIERWDEDPAR